MKIVDPTQGRVSLGHDLESVADLALSGRVCLLSNSKPNAEALLHGVAARTPRLRGAPLFAKGTAALPAPADLLDLIARDHDAALVAIGD
jgi:hypothetical protein